MMTTPKLVGTSIKILIGLNNKEDEFLTRQEQFVNMLDEFSVVRDPTYMVSVLHSLKALNSLSGATQLLSTYESCLLVWFWLRQLFLVWFESHPTLYRFSSSPTCSSIRRSRSGISNYKSERERASRIWKHCSYRYSYRYSDFY